MRMGANWAFPINTKPYQNVCHHSGKQRTSPKGYSIPRASATMRMGGDAFAGANLYIMQSLYAENMAF
jgi:hypothetical protein